MVGFAVTGDIVDVSRAEHMDRTRPREPVAWIPGETTYSATVDLAQGSHQPE